MRMKFFKNWQFWFVGCVILMIGLFSCVIAQAYADDSNTPTVDNTCPKYLEPVIRGGVKIEKRDYSTQALSPVGGATLAGAKFDIVSLNDNKVRVDGKEYSKNETVKTLITDEKGKAETSNDCLPYGTYTIRETTPNTGYRLTDDKSRTFKIEKEGYMQDYTGTASWFNKVYRGGMNFSKKMSDTGERGKYILFALTSKSTGETHIIATDENGSYDSESTAHSKNTNALDDLVREATDSDEYSFEYNGKSWTYKEEYLRQATDSDKYSFDANGAKWTLDESKIVPKILEFGTWFGMDQAGNMAQADDSEMGFPYDTELFNDGGYVLQELPCNNNAGYELVTTTLNVRKDGQQIDYGTINDPVSPKLLISKLDATGQKEVEGAKLKLEKLNDNGVWETVEEWTSTSESHEVLNVTAGAKYRLSETLAPKTYEQASSIEFTMQADQAIKEVVMKDEPIEITGQIDKRQTSINEMDDANSYIYTVDYKNTSNVWADEMNMWDTLDCAIDGKSYLQYLNTPVLFGDYDGKMNVWYKTNKTDDSDTSDSSSHNACSTNPLNPHNPNNERVHDYTGWKLWKSDVSTLKSETLKIEDLNLADGEYVTGVAFEHGRVEVGAGSAKADSGQWTREGVKNDSDFINSEKDSYCTKTIDDNGIVTVVHNDTFFDADGNEIAYQPAVFGMRATDEVITQGDIELWNSADMDIHRNLAPDEPKLNDDDEDKVVQKTSVIYLSKVDATTGAEIEGAQLVLEKKLSDGSWKTVDEWISTGEIHKVGGEVGATYRLTETLAPKTYVVSDPVEFTFNGGGIDNKVVMKDEPIEISGQIDKRESALYEIDNEGSYIYTIDYRNKSNVWADEMNMWDIIDCAVEGKAYFQYVKTPVFYGDYDGKMNVWYKTNKTPKDYVESEDEDGYVPNACATNPENPHNPYNERVHDFTGWKCAGSVSTLTSSTLSIKSFNLDDDEYITGIAFEHGRVEVGAGTSSSDSSQWTRDFLKDESDIVGADKDAYMVKTIEDDGSVSVKHGCEFTASDGKTYIYQPVVVGMKATEETMKTGGIELYNTAEMDIHRNLAPDEPELNDDDEDKVVLKTPRIGTTLTDKSSGAHEAYPSKDTILIDKVEYEGLISGKEYVIMGTLMDKDSENVLISNDQEVTARGTFTPESATGTVEIEFTFDSSSMLGKTTVAYEDLYRNDQLIYSEHDINNPDQTVTFKETPKTPETPGESKKGSYYDKTGQDMRYAMIALGVGVAGVSYCASFYFFRKAGMIVAIKSFFKK